MLADVTQKQDTTMPTSSQAMILRHESTSHRHPAAFNFEYSPPKGQPLNSSSDFERVQFDFGTDASPDQSTDYEGVFTFNNKTNSYRWQIFPIDQDGKSGEGPRMRRNKENADGYLYEGDQSITWRKGYANDGHKTDRSLENRLESPERYCPVHNPRPGRRSQRGDRNNEYHLTILPDDDRYQRLEELGFRRRTPRFSTIGPPLIQRQRNKPKPPKQIPPLAFENLDDTESVGSKISTRRNGPTPILGTLISESTRKRARTVAKKSLLDEIKDTVNWTKRVVPNSHPRPLTSRPRHNVVCFSLRDCYNMSHYQVKELVESQIQCKVRNLQFDAVSVRQGDKDMLDRWLVGLGSRGNCIRAIERGLTVNGDKVIVRSWEDIQHEETIYTEAEDSWRYPDTYQLQSQKHTRALKKFLHEN